MEIEAEQALPKDESWNYLFSSSISYNKIEFLIFSCQNLNEVHIAFRLGLYFLIIWKSYFVISL